MKYKLLQKLPWMEVWTIIEWDKLWNIILPFWYTNIWNIEEYPDFFEEVKEVKTIKDLKKWDKYYVLDDWNEITKFEVPSNTYFDNPYCRFNCFVTEREAKRNKLLRELATREKWLPEDNDTWYDMDWCYHRWNWNHTQMIFFHQWLVFENEWEYKQWITPENADLLFKL